MNRIHDPFSQAGYALRLEWGRDGAARAAAHGDIVVIVDVLSFSTVVSAAAERGGSIIPCESNASAENAALQPDVSLAVRREDAGSGQYSLSPVTYRNLGPGQTVALPSPNGATCTRRAVGAPVVYAGCLRNARAVARQISNHVEHEACAISVVACGERWNGEDGDIRFAVEDYLGAGAILSAVTGSLSPEAELCALAFDATGGRLREIMRNCSSGLELTERGYSEDVEFALSLDATEEVPVLAGDRYTGICTISPGEVGA